MKGTAINAGIQEHNNSLGNNIINSFYITVANVISTIAVILLHANSRFWSYSESYYWLSANAVESVFNFAVPVFFMITGATLIDYRKRYNTGVFLKKRFVKTVIPFIAWNIIGVVWFYKQDILNVIKGKGISSCSFDFDEMVNGLINNRFVGGVYWFFIPIFCVYLIIPFLSCISEEKKIKLFFYVVIISFGINVLVPFLLSLLPFFSIDYNNWNLKIYVGYEYLLYVLIGYLVHRCDIKKKFRLLVYLFAVIGLALHFLGTWYVSSTRGELDCLFKGYYKLPCVLYAVGVFIFIKSICVRHEHKIWHIIFDFLHKYTFGLYLVHVFILEIFYLVATYLGLSFTSDIFVLLALLFTVPIGIAVIALLRKIPVIRYIVP